MDIVTRCGVPRYLHTDMPLGNALGHPGDRDLQKQTVAAALDLLESATEPTVVRGGLHWAETEAWKDNYMRIDDLPGLAAAGVENRRKRKAEIDAGLRRAELRREKL